MPDITVHCEKDGMLATLSIADGCRHRFTLPELSALLSRYKVLYGIDQKTLEEIASGARRGQGIPVAYGVPAEAWIPGRLEWYIDFSKAGKPRALEDGRVNLRDLQIHQNVRKGEKLVRRIAPVPGKPGKTIFGTPVFLPPPEDVCITAGKGTVHDAGNPDCITASIDGAVVFDRGIVEVHNQKEIQGNIDYATGNVFFNGDLEINGSVRAGFTVSAQGDIEINGNVEETEIKAGGSIIVRGGATGSGSGAISCGGSLKIHHVDNFYLSAGRNIIIEENALNSTILSEGDVVAKAIVGGSVCAFAVNIESSGSASETRTLIDVTKDSQLSRERYDLLKKFGALMAERTALYNKMYALVRNGMDEKGTLPNSDIHELELLKRNTLQSITIADSVQERLEKIDELEKDRKGDSIVTIGIAYPNTLIRIGAMEHLIREEQRNIHLTSNLRK